MRRRACPTPHPYRRSGCPVGRLALVRLRNFKDLRSFFDDAEGRALAGRASEILRKLARCADARGPFRISDPEFALIYPSRADPRAVATSILGAFAAESVADSSPLRFEVQVGSYRTGKAGKAAMRLWRRRRRRLPIASPPIRAPRTARAARPTTISRRELPPSCRTSGIAAFPPYSSPSTTCDATASASSKPSAASRGRSPRLPRGLSVGDQSARAGKALRRFHRRRGPRYGPAQRPLRQLQRHIRGLEPARFPRGPLQCLCLPVRQAEHAHRRADRASRLHGLRTAAGFCRRCP